MNDKQKAYLQHYQDECAKLPSDIATFANKYFIQYFNEFVNTIDSWHDEPLPDGYIPHSFEIYYGTSHSPHIHIVDGVLEEYTLPELEKNSPSVTLIIDSNFVYIEVEGKEILNKIGGAILPKIITNPSLLLSSLTNRSQYSES
ncbi:hypothetical protein [Nostoc sp. CCY0012]|uniref:hypothetical protein n=1 Tax=Nostoc sp. CCY0012 TaxID=1056123 RepID=UPI0039C732E6